MANLDTGNTGFMILCSSLVMLMTPGLAFFYGGLVSRTKRARHHDAVLRLDGLDNGDLVRRRLFALLFRRRRRGDRQSGHGLPAGRDARDAIAHAGNPACWCTSPTR